MKQLSIEELESYFKSRDCTNEPPIVLDPAQTVTDVQALITGHLRFLQSNAGRERFKPYYERLLLVYHTLRSRDN